MSLEVLLLVAVTLASEVAIAAYSIATLKRIAEEISEKIKEIREAIKETKQPVRQEAKVEEEEQEEQKTGRGVLWNLGKAKGAKRKP